MSRRILLLLLAVLCLSLSECAFSDLYSAVFAQKPEHAVLFVIDGLSYKVWEKMELPTLERMAGQGALIERMYLPPAAHPHTGVYARLHTCSIPNPIMMAGTVFIDERTGYLPQSFFPSKTTAFSVNSLAYQSINQNYHHSFQRNGPDETAVVWALTFMELGRPAFLRVHLQDSGGAGNRSMRAPEDASWRFNIWADDSPYRLTVTRADSLLGVFVNGIERLGVLESTVIIVLGDHGQNDGGWHPLEFVDSSVTTAVIWGAGVKQGIRIPYAEIIDIVPTICAFMNVEPPLTSQGRIAAEAMSSWTGDYPPRQTLIRDMLDLFVEYRTKTAEARYLLEDVNNGAEGALFSRLNQSVLMPFYDIHTFTEWPRFASLDELLAHNRKIMTALDTLVEDIRTAHIDSRKN